jgi:hypothetical protein
MKKTILTFGLISGAISAFLLAATIPFADRIGFDKGEYFGYTIIVLSLLLVYFGIRSYRDNVANGHITFGKAFIIGLGITVISCLGYVAAWELIYFKFMPDFMDKYGAYMVQKLQASGATSAAIRAQLLEIKKYQQLYDNPLTNAALTFIEPFPVGLVMTLISAAILRRKPQDSPSQSPAAAS